MRIIIIDDEFMITKAISESLKQSGHHIAGTAGNVARGLALCEESDIDLAIIDLNLNGASAEPLAMKLMDRNIPTLVISGSGAEKMPRWASGFLAKPFSPHDLLEVIESIRQR